MDLPDWLERGRGGEDKGLSYVDYVDVLDIVGAYHGAKRGKVPVIAPENIGEGIAVYDGVCPSLHICSGFWFGNHTCGSRGLLSNLRVSAGVLGLIDMHKEVLRKLSLIKLGEVVIKVSPHFGRAEEVGADEEEDAFMAPLDTLCVACELFGGDERYRALSLVPNGHARNASGAVVVVLERINEVGRRKHDNIARRRLRLEIYHRVKIILFSGVRRRELLDAQHDHQERTY